MSATWVRCWVVTPEGTHLITCEASTSSHGNVTVRPLSGRDRGTRRYEPHWFERLYGSTPEEAIEKFIHRHTLQITRWRQDIAAGLEMIHSAEELRRQHAAREETTH